jgi:signal peptidase I
MELNLKSMWKNHKEKKLKQKQIHLTATQKVVSWVKTLVGAIIVVMIINGLAIASFVVPTGSMENTVMTGDFLFVNKFIYGPTTPQVVPFFNVPLPFYKFPGIKHPEKGDVIVFIFPGMRDEVEPQEFQYYLKRCVATAGDSLQVIDKKLFVNGKEIAMTPHAHYDDSRNSDQFDAMRTFPYGKGWTRDNYGPIRIPKKGDVVELNQRNLREWLVLIRREGHEVSTDGQNILIDGKPSTSYKIARNYCFGMGDNRDNSLDSRYWGFIPEENIVGSPLIVYWSWNTDLPFKEIVDKLSSVRWSRIGTLIR